MREREYDEAGKLCQKILGKNKEQWEMYILIFTQANQIPVSCRLLYAFLYVCMCMYVRIYVCLCMFLCLCVNMCILFGKRTTFMWYMYDGVFVEDWNILKFYNKLVTYV